MFSSVRFFLGKNRVIAIALGRTKEAETNENLHEISKRLKGQCGILFTNKSKEEVLKYVKLLCLFYSIYCYWAVYYGFI